MDTEEVMDILEAVVKMEGMAHQEEMDMKVKTPLILHYR